MIGGLHHSSIASSFECPDGPTFSTATTYSFPSNSSDGILFLPSEEHQRYDISTKMPSTITLPIVNQVHVVQQRILLTVQILLLNLPTLLDPKGRTLNRESIVSASQIMVKQHQGLKQQKQTNCGAEHENVKLWCIGMEVVGISMLQSHLLGRYIFISVQTNLEQIYVLFFIYDVV